MAAQSLEAVPSITPESTGAQAGPSPSSGAASAAAARGLKQCLKMVDYARKNSPRINSLLRKIEGRGCDMGVTPIVCEDVFGDAPAIGGYHAGRRVVVMNPAVPPSFLTQHQWTRGITHELVHAYDHCRAEVDNSNPKHIACTEIRAANLSGDCDFSDELRRSGFRFEIAGLQKNCVRKRALQSMQMTPDFASLGKIGIERHIDEVFEPCYRDTAPFATN